MGHGVGERSVARRRRVRGRGGGEGTGGPVCVGGALPFSCRMRLFWMVGPDRSGKEAVPSKCSVLMSRLEIKMKKRGLCPPRALGLGGYVTCHKANLAQCSHRCGVCVFVDTREESKDCVVLPEGIRESFTEEAACRLRTERSTRLPQGQNQDNLCR